MKTRFAIIMAILCATLVAAPLPGRAAGDIVADWHFNESAGTAVSDSSGYGNNGTFGLASLSFDPERIGDGKLGGALRFDGNDHVAVEHSSTIEPAHITVEAWVRSLPGAPPYGWSYVVSKSSVDCGFAAWALYTGATGGMHFYINGGGCIMTEGASPRQLWDGQWHHIAGTFDGAAVRLFVDGVEVGNGMPYTGPLYYPGDVASNRKLYIGSYESQICSLPFRGDIDEVRVWSRALSPCEIATRAQG